MISLDPSKTLYRVFASSRYKILNLVRIIFPKYINGEKQGMIWSLYD